MNATNTTNLFTSPAQDQGLETSTEWRWYHLLPVVAAAIYIFTPILSLQFGVPGAVKYLGDAIVIVMIALSIGWMFINDRIPGMFLVILAITVIGAMVASFEGQSSVVTVYGWWMMFRYPMVGLYVYLIPDWPKQLTSLIPKAMTYLLAIEVLVQIILYLTGTRDFDNLAGTFGWKGVGPFIYFIFLVLALALGKWLVIGEWKMLAITLVLSAFASAVGEMKLFLIGAPLMAILALGVHLFRGAQFRKLFIYILFFSVAGTSFLLAYDRLIVEGLGRPPLENYLDSENRDRYLEFTLDSGDKYLLGRNRELEYGWQTIQRDNTTLLFGHGLGTRQYSPELGLVGEGLYDSLYGMLVGRTLLVMMYETGLAGLAVLLIFTVFTVVVLYRASLRDTDLAMNVLRFGLLFYTFFWPLWIWYQSIWLFSAPSILYWMLWGYTMRYSVGHTFRQPSTITSAYRQLQIVTPKSVDM